MKKFFLLLAAAMLLVFGFSACDDGGDDGSSDVTELEGSWITGCMDRGDEGEQHIYDTKTMIFDGNDLQWIKRAYSDDSCTTIYTAADGEFQNNPYEVVNTNFSIEGNGSVAGTKKIQYKTGDLIMQKLLYRINADGTLEISDDSGDVDSEGYYYEFNDSDPLTRL